MSETSEMVKEQRRGSRWRRWRLFGLIAILAMFAAYVVFDLWAGYRVGSIVERLEQRYGTLAEDSLRTAAVPPDENRARLVRAAAALGVQPTPAVRTLLTHLANSPKISAIPAEVTQLVEANREALRIAATFTSRERSSWETEPDGSHGPELLEIRMLSDVLFAQAASELAAARPDEASKAIAAALAVSASLRQENQLVAQLIRIAIAARQIDAIQHLLAESEPSAAALDELARRLAENRTPDPIRLGLAGELKLGHAGFSRLETGRSDGSIVRPGRFSGLLFRMGRPFVRMGHASYLQTVEQLLELQAGPRPKGPFPSEDGWFAFGFTAGLARSIETGDDFTSMQGAAETAVALRRYRIARGSYPDDLTALVPDYLPALPIDPFTGKPPVYARKDAGFTLESQRYMSQTLPKSRPAMKWEVHR